jgi:hypothetical protein
MDRATRAIRFGKFADAVSVLEKLVDERPTYHVAWLKLSSALREKAVRDQRVGASLTDVQQTLNRAADAAEQAQSHVDESYQAEAYYQASKTKWRIWKLNGNTGKFVLAQKDARCAVERSDDTRYRTWLDRLERECMESQGEPVHLPG